MSTDRQLPYMKDLKPRLTVIGIGGAGCNAVNNMISSGLTGVDFVVANTDAQALAASSAEHRLQLGVNLTEGLGAGAKPEIGQAAAEEAIEDIRKQVQGSHMVFIAAGMGGGTGTGAAAVIARVAKDLGILTVGVVTKPFQFEGARRMRIAEAGIAELKPVVDTLIVIPNQNLFRIASDKTTFAEAFLLADQVLYSGVACIVDLIIKEGLINLDFADVRTIMSGMGTAMMGTGEASGEGRAIAAAEEAISNPLLDDVSLKGAKGLLLSITGGHNLTLYEVDEAASRVRQEVDSEANIIVGATFDETLNDRVRVSIVASGMARLGEAGQPLPRSEPRPDGRKSAAFSTSNQGEAYVSEQEMQRRLSEALQGPGSEPGSVRQGSDAGYPSSPPPIPNRDVRRMPGNVTIEDGLPPLRSGAPHARPYDGLSPDTPPPPAPVSAFVPQPPELPRGAQRRMPRVEDFPAIGQREFRAKTSPSGMPQARQPMAYDPDDQPRRRGLLERITGRILRGADQPDRGSESGAEEQSPGHVNRSAPQHGQSPALGRQSGSPRTQEEAELPVFFTRERK